jgi:hypothetical protein
MHHDSRVLRDRLAAYDDAFDAAQAGGDEDCSAAFLGKTTTITSYPTSATATFAVTPVDVSGTEAEGSSASYTPRAGVVAFATNLGSSVPPSGTLVVCHVVGGRNIFRYDSTS